MRNSRITRDVTASVPPFGHDGGLNLDDLRYLVDATSELPGDTVLRGRVTVSILSPATGSLIRSITVPAAAAPAEGA